MKNDQNCIKYNIFDTKKVAIADFINILLDYYKVN